MKNQGAFCYSKKRNYGYVLDIPPVLLDKAKKVCE